MSMTMRWSGWALMAATLTAGPCGPALAAPPPVAAPPAAAAATPAKPAVDAAALVVQDFYVALFESMRHANEWHMQGRYDHLHPVMLKLFDVPAMTRIAVGPDFAKLDPRPADGALRDAFGRLLVATFASTFDDFKGRDLRGRRPTRRCAKARTGS